MCDEFIHQGLVQDPRISRRTFGLLTAAAAGTAGGALAEAKVVEKEVDIKTPDGTCDAVLYYPEGKGAWPAVLIWTDVMGLRPAFREMGRRMADQGYVVLVPNPYYRVKRAPVIDGTFNFDKPEDRAKLVPFRSSMSDARTDSDAGVLIAYLDSLPQTDKTKKAGVQGYCMGGALTFRTAAVVPDRIAAVGSFHGGNGLVTKDANSPHLLIPKAKATFLVCQAQNDDAQAPTVKDDLKAAFIAAKRPATVEVFPADHGWCVKGGTPYNEAQADRAWSELTKLYKATLV